MAREFSIQTLYNASAAGTGSWFNLDYRDDRGETERIVSAAMHGSDTITVEGSVDQTTAHVLDTLGGATADFGVISGPWPYIRVIKAGTNGVATVKLVG